MNPADLKYAKTHEWVSLAGDVATVGISAFAIEALTDLVFMELPVVGKQVEPEQPMCEVESVKAVSDVYAPVAGEVIEVNESLPDNLEVLGTDPYGEGWIAKIRLAAGAGTDHLLDHAAYEKQCAEEG
ncbi:MAG: glycine cleavage system protein GcvH [Planctomycetales bacterium]|nr:glycine cleavage system protein GcvH [Planctomycetales bacterium]